MRKILAIVFLLISVNANGQMPVPSVSNKIVVGDNVRRYIYGMGGLYIDSTVYLPYYRMQGDTALIGVDNVGRLYRITKSKIQSWSTGGGAQTLDQVLANGSNAPTKTMTVGKVISQASDIFNPSNSQAIYFDPAIPALIFSKSNGSSTSTNSWYFPYNENDTFANRKFVADYVASHTTGVDTNSIRNNHGGTAQNGRINITGSVISDDTVKGRAFLLYDTTFDGHMVFRADAGKWGVKSQFTGTREIFTSYPGRIDISNGSNKIISLSVPPGGAAANATWYFDGIGGNAASKDYVDNAFVTEKTKLAGIADGATANQSDAVTNAAIAGKEPILSGAGFVKKSGTTTTYDNTAYYPSSNPSGYTSNVGTVTGTGSSSYLSKWNSSTGLANSQIIDDGSVLRLYGNTGGAGIEIYNTNSSGYSGLEFHDNTLAGAVFMGYNNGNPGEFRFNNFSAGGNIRFKIAGNDRLVVANSGIIEISNNINIGSTPEYADNAAATTAGLPVGRIYRTGDVLKIVH